jgi:hypothetical protein
MGSKLELRNKEHIRYITSNNPQSAYTNHILDNAHEYGPLVLPRPYYNRHKKADVCIY